MIQLVEKYKTLWFNFSAGVNTDVNAVFRSGNIDRAALPDMTQFLGLSSKRLGQQVRFVGRLKRYSVEQKYATKIEPMNITSVARNNHMPSEVGVPARPQTERREPSVTVPAVLVSTASADRPGPAGDLSMRDIAESPPECGRDREEVEEFFHG